MQIGSANMDHVFPVKVKVHMVPAVAVADTQVVIAGSSDVIIMYLETSGVVSASIVIKVQPIAGIQINYCSVMPRIAQEDITIAKKRIGHGIGGNGSCCQGRQHYYEKYIFHFFTFFNIFRFVG